MRNDIAGPETESTTAMWEGLEGVVREKAQEFIQQILEEEVTELLGREKSERKAAVDAAPGYRNGYGKGGCRISSIKAVAVGWDLDEVRESRRSIGVAPGRISFCSPSLCQPSPPPMSAMESPQRSCDIFPAGVVLSVKVP